MIRTRKYPEHFPRRAGSRDVTDTDHYAELDMEMSSVQLKPTPSNPHSTKFRLRYMSKRNLNDDYIYQPSDNIPMTLQFTRVHTTKRIRKHSRGT